jgi:hypothetical protein
MRVRQVAANMLPALANATIRGAMSTGLLTLRSFALPIGGGQDRRRN